MGRKPRKLTIAKGALDVNPAATRPWPDLDLAALVSQCAQGDQRAFAALYDATSPRLFALTVLVLRDQVRAVQATRAAYREIWQQSAGFDAGQGSVRAWLTGIAYHHALRLRPGA